MAACPDCGETAAELRFCGGCGALLRPRDPTPAPLSRATSEVPGPQVPALGHEQLLDDEPRDEEAGAAAPSGSPARRRLSTRRLRIVGLAATICIALAMSLSQVMTDDDHSPVAGTAAASSGRTDSVAPGRLARVVWERPVPAVEPVAATGDVWIGELTAGHVMLHTPTGQLALPRENGRGTPAIIGGPSAAGWFSQHWWPAGLEPVADAPRYLLGGGRLLTVDAHGGVLTSAPVSQDLAEATSQEAWPAGSGRILTAVRDGVAMLAADGTTIWHYVAERDPSRGHWGVSLAHVGQHDLVVRTGSEVVALDRTSGEVRWSSDFNPEAGVEPLITDDLVVVSSRGGTTAIDRDSGEPRWETGEVTFGARWLGVADGAVLALADSGSTELWRIDAEHGTVIEVVSTPIADLWEATLVDDVLVGRAGDGTGDAVGMTADGQVGWRRPSRGVRVLSDPARGRDVAVIMAGTELYIVAPDSGRVLEVLRLADARARPASGQTLALHGRSLFLRMPGNSGAGTFVDLATGTPLPELSLYLQDAGWGPAPTMTSSLMGMGGPTGRLRLFRPDGTELEDVSHDIFGLVGELPGGVVALHGGRGNHPQPVLLDPLTGEPLDPPADPGDAGADDPAWPQLWHSITAGSDALLAPGWDADDGREVLVAVTAAGGTLEAAWQRPLTARHILADEHRAVLVAHATVQVLDLADGDVVRTFVLGRLPSGHALADGVLVSVAGDRLEGVQVDDPDRRWTVSLPAAATSAPIIAGDEVLLGLEGGRIVRFGLDGSPRGTAVQEDAPVRELFAAYGMVVAVTDARVVAWGPEQLPPALQGQPPALGRVEIP